MIQVFEEVPPSCEEITNYDFEHKMLYICLLGRKEKGRDWRETMRAYFAIDFDHQPEPARAAV
jgi:predicted SprT family Zn-dependent metalloprotease